MVEMDTLDLREVLAWIEVAAEDMSAAENLDFVLKLRKLVKSSAIDFERVGWFSFSVGDRSKITRLDLVLDFYQAVKSEGLKLRDVKEDVKQISRAIASGIVDQTIGVKAGLWEQRKQSLLETLQKKKKNKERSTDEKVFIEDVEMLKQRFSLQHSLLLAELQQYNRLYESDRLAVLWHVLRYDFKTQELILPLGTVVESDTSQAEASFIFQRLTVRGKVQPNKKRPRTSVETPSNLLAERDTYVSEQRLCHLFPTLTPGEKQMCFPLNTIAAVNYLSDIALNQLDFAPLPGFDYYGLPSMLSPMDSDKLPSITKETVEEALGGQHSIKNIIVGLPKGNIQEESRLIVTFESSKV